MNDTNGTNTRNLAEDPMDHEFWTVGKAIVALAIVAGLAAILSRGRGARNEAGRRRDPAKTVLESWIGEELARAVGKRLKLPPAALSARDSSDAVSPEWRSRMAEEVADTVVRFIRTTKPGEVLVHLRIAYRKGGCQEMETRLSWDDLPAEIRAQFLKSGVPELECPWKWA